MPSDCTGPLGPPSSSPSSSDSDPDRDLGGALHEVSNALTVIVGWLERARAEGTTPADLRRAVDVAYARAIDGRVIARRAIGAAAESRLLELPLPELVAEATTGVSPEAAAKDVTFFVSSDPKDTTLVDEARIALQIATNLLLNAIAFSPRGGRVHVEAESDDVEIVLRVRDEGPGVPSDRRDRVFARGRSTRNGGAGIGLSHARALARRNGGDLTLEPSKSGACFALRWPRAAVRSQRAVVMPGATALAGRRLLVVEDDAAVLILLETALTARGAEVVCARSPGELTEAVADGGFHAALVDLSPIEGDTAKLLSAMQATSPGLRVVVISGSAAPPPAEIVAAATAWVRKPFELSEIVAAVAARPA